MDYITMCVGKLAMEKATDQSKTDYFMKDRQYRVIEKDGRDLKPL